jgi:putative hemolysin
LVLWDYVGIAVIFVLLYLSYRLSGAETALTALTPLEVSDLVAGKAKGAEKVTKLKTDLDRTVITLLVSATVVNVAIASVTTLIAVALLGHVWVSLVVGVMTLVLLIVGEITPKAYAIDNRIKLSQRNAGWVLGMSMALGPLVSGLMWITRGLLSMAGMDTKERTHLLVSDETIKRLATLGLRQGTVDDVELSIITKVLDFAAVDVDDLMVDRPHVFSIPSGTELNKAKEMLYGRAFTRVPVLRTELQPGGADPSVCATEVVGVVHVKDLIGKEGKVIDDFVRPPFVVTPEREAADLFEEMRRKRIHMAIVCDGEGRMLGVITLEDLIEKVMGEIRDEVHERQFPHGEPP